MLNGVEAKMRDNIRLFLVCRGTWRRWRDPIYVRARVEERREGTI